MLKKYIDNWHKNKENELWMNPPNGLWRQVINDDILLIDSNGEIISEEIYSIKDSWKRLVFEADLNLEKEDNSARIILADLGDLFKEKISLEKLIEFMA